MNSLEEIVNMYLSLKAKDLIPIYGPIHFTRRTMSEEHSDTLLKKISIIARAAALTAVNFYFIWGTYKIGEIIYKSF